jgi:integrase
VQAHSHWRAKTSRRSRCGAHYRLGTSVLGSRRNSAGLIFGTTTKVDPFGVTSVIFRALTAWGWQRVKRDGKLQWVKAREDAMQPITMHECRHTFASLMIAAGVNAKALSVYMGHSGIRITMDRYGHLMPGNEDEAAGMLDATWIGPRRPSAIALRARHAL